MSSTETLGTDAELDAADALGGELVRLIRTLSRVKTQVLNAGPDGLERAAYGLLFCLVQHGPLRTSQLAESLHIEISTVSRQAGALVEHGLIERQADPDDGRATLLAPTAEGFRVFEENRRLRNERLARITADWPAGDREQLTELLGRLSSRIEMSQPETNVPGRPEGNNA